jgi:hypothetical protein
VKLTKTEYLEKIANKIEPINNDYPDGIHTVNYDDGLFVIDAKKYQFYWYKIFVNIYRKIKKRL